MPPFALSADRLPLLLTGVSGVAGYNAFFALPARYPGRVVGIRPANTTCSVAKASWP